MPKFRKKPEIVEAVQFTGTNQSCADVTLLLADVEGYYWDLLTNDGGRFWIHDDLFSFTRGDWVIKGPAGKLNTLPDGAFQAEYDPVEPGARVSLTMQVG